MENSIPGKATGVRGCSRLRRYLTLCSSILNFKLFRKFL